MATLAKSLSDKSRAHYEQVLQKKKNLLINCNINLALICIHFCHVCNSLLKNQRQQMAARDVEKRQMFETV